MSKIGFLTYSLPFKWWNDTNIAHNKIWAWLVTLLAEHGHTSIVFNKVDAMTATYMKRFNCYRAEPKDLDRVDTMVVFCGPHLPMNKDSILFNTLSTLRRYSGKARFVTCDYLLQFDFNGNRYGPLVADWGEDFLVKNKKWKYILHGGFDHHFRTESQRDKVLKFITRKKFVEIPLNMGGIHPNHQRIYWHETPPVDLVYCGAFRKGRVDFFKKYFCSNYARNWTISTTQEKKFRSLPGLKANVRGPFPGNIWNVLNKSCAQIISGDKNDTHHPTTPLPTRYWEALSAKTPMVFDRSCDSWRELWNSVSHPIFVDGPEQLFDVIRNWKANRMSRIHVIREQQLSLDNIDLWVNWKLESWLT